LQIDLGILGSICSYVVVVPPTFMLSFSVSELLQYTWEFQ